MTEAKQHNSGNVRTTSQKQSSIYVSVKTIQHWQSSMMLTQMHNSGKAVSWWQNSMAAQLDSRGTLGTRQNSTAFDQHSAQPCHIHVGNKHLPQVKQYTCNQRPGDSILQVPRLHTHIENSTFL